MNGKKLKNEVDYTEKGTKEEHCGPDKDWLEGYCSHYVPKNNCMLVKGFIYPKGWCRLYESPADEEAEGHEQVEDLGK